MRKIKKPQTIILVVLMATLVGLTTKHQAITDWLRLRGYTPPSAVAQLATDDTMTAKARHLFYVNHPNITSGGAFTSHCPAGGEKTVVLGCYISNDDGIYIYQVSDARLNGVEQVTAAHETLHAAYRRLSTSERTTIDAMLMDYYDHDLTDQRIKDTIAAYKQSEPNDVVNEMHSIFGTEIASLPAPLENYYKQYFANRAQITNYTTQYQGEFTSREYQIKTDNTQLALLKTQIDADEAELSQQTASLETQSQQLQTERESGQISTYNDDVASYNTAVDSYNSLLTTTKNLINQYNSTVNARNSVALEEQQLSQELTSGNLPGAK